MEDDDESNGRKGGWRCGRLNGCSNVRVMSGKDDPTVIYERTKPDVGKVPLLGGLHHMPDPINLSSRSA